MRARIVAIQNSPNFIVIMYDTEEQALDALYFDVVDTYAVLPYGFEGNITNDIPAFVDLHISSTDFDSLTVVTGQFSKVVQDFRYDHGWIQGEISSQNFPEFQPEGASSINPILDVIPLQLLSYFLSVDLGINPDLPRNLSKTLTVD